MALSRVLVWYIAGSNTKDIIGKQFTGLAGVALMTKRVLSAASCAVGRMNFVLLHRWGFNRGATPRRW
jgi:hypothetical protein